MLHSHTERDGELKGYCWSFGIYVGKRRRLALSVVLVRKRLQFWQAERLDYSKVQMCRQKYEWIRLLYRFQVKINKLD